MSSRRRLAAWTLLYLLSRAVILLTQGPALYQHDELYAGAVALEMQAGRGLPLALSAHTPYCGGPILVAWVAGWVFQALGTSVASLRLLSILMLAGTFAATLDLVGRMFGDRARDLTALLFLLPPPYYGTLSILAWGNHAESTFPSCLALALIAAALADGGDLSTVALAGRRRRPLWLGLAAGIAAASGLWFSYAALVYIIAIGVVIVVLGRRTRPILAAFVAGAGVGAIPTIALNLAWRTSGVMSLAHLARPDPSDLPRRLLSLLGFELRWYLAPHAYPPPVELLFWLATGAAIAVASIRIVRRLRFGATIPGEALVVLPVLGFMAVAVLSSFPIGPRATGFFGYRYFAVITPGLLAALGVSLARLPSLAGWIAATALLGPPALLTLRALPTATTFTFHQSPASYMAYAVHAYETLDYARGPAYALIDQIPPGETRTAAVRGLAGVDITHHFTRYAGGPAEQLAAYLENGFPADPADAALFRERLAHALTATRGLCLRPGDFAALTAPLATLPDDPHGRRIVAGTLFSLDSRSGVTPPAESMVPSAAVLAEIVSSLPRSLRAGANEGLGMIAARRHRDSHPDPPTPTAGYAVDYWRGYGYLWTRIDLQTGDDLAVATGELPEPEQSAVRAGAEAALFGFEPENLARRRLLRLRFADRLPRGRDTLDR